MYDSFREKAVLIVVCRDVDLLVCQRVDTFRLTRCHALVCDLGDIVATCICDEVHFNMLLLHDS